MFEAAEWLLSDVQDRRVVHVEQLVVHVPAGLQSLPIVLLLEATLVRLHVEDLGLLVKRQPVHLANLSSLSLKLM